MSVHCLNAFWDYQLLRPTVLIPSCELLDIADTHFYHQERDSNHNDYCQNAVNKPGQAFTANSFPSPNLMVNQCWRQKML